MIAILLFLAVLIPFYKRYIPVRNIPCVSLESLDRENTVVLDIRDYNVSDKNEVREAIKLPLAYINRNSRIYQAIESIWLFLTIWKKIWGSVFCVKRDFMLSDLLFQTAIVHKRRYRT